MQKCKDIRFVLGASVLALLIIVSSTIFTKKEDFALYREYASMNRPTYLGKKVVSRRTALRSDLKLTRETRTMIACGDVNYMIYIEKIGPYEIRIETPE